MNKEFKWLIFKEQRPILLLIPSSQHQLFQFFTQHQQIQMSQHLTNTTYSQQEKLVHNYFSLRRVVKQLVAADPPTLNTAAVSG